MREKNQYAPIKACFTSNPRESQLMHQIRSMDKYLLYIQYDSFSQALLNVYAVRNDTVLESFAQIDTVYSSDACPSPNAPISTAKYSTVSSGMLELPPYQSLHY